MMKFTPWLFHVCYPGSGAGPPPQGDRLCLSFPVVDLKQVVTWGKRCRPLLLKAFSGQTACCLSLNVSGFVPAPLLPWVNWAVPFFLSPRQPKLHFHRWSVPQCQWAGGVTRWPSTFWNWFHTVSFFKGSFGEVAAANWSRGGPSSLLVLNGQQHLINFVLISVGHSWLEKGNFCLSH